MDSQHRYISEIDWITRKWIMRCRDLAKVREQNCLYISNDDIVTELCALLNEDARGGKHGEAGE